jgi:TfoX/Sxy family transcriptional regulator of competence genes
VKRSALDAIGYDGAMAWIKIPPENHPLFLAALPKDRRIETIQMFGGIAARVNGNVFAGLFGRSTMVWLDDAARAEALALEGAEPFDPMGDGRMRSDKVMLPEAIMDEPDELRRWIARAFEGAARLPPKAAGAKSKKRPAPSSEGPAKKPASPKKKPASPKKKPSPKRS